MRRSTITTFVYNSEEVFTLKRNINTLLFTNIKYLRKKHKLSQEELSESLHLARSTYSSYETGSKLPDLQTLCALSAFYGISIDSLVNIDMSKGLYNQIYCSETYQELASIAKFYQSLSAPSKIFITQHLGLSALEISDCSKLAASPASLYAAQLLRQPEPLHK